MEDRGRAVDFAWVNTGNPVTLTAPDEPAPYEVRYQQGQSKRALSRARIVVR